MGYFVEEHCGSCGGVGRDEYQRVCLNCKGTGIVEGWYEPPTKKMTAEEKRIIRKLDQKKRTHEVLLYSMLWLAGLILVIVGTITWDWQIKRVVGYLCFGLFMAIYAGFYIIYGD
jgi:Ca2+/Na+ antiporter